MFDYMMIIDVSLYHHSFFFGNQEYKRYADKVSRKDKKIIVKMQNNCQAGFPFWMTSAEYFIDWIRDVMVPLPSSKLKEV